MYHKAETPFSHSYYDTIEEIPQSAKVYFPNEKEPKEMTAEQMLQLSDEGWFTIMHSVNYGSCDHWISKPLSKWVNERFLSCIRYTDRNNNTLGYNRKEWSVVLTKDSKYWKSEVWNS